MMFVLGSFSYCHYEKLLGNLLKINALVNVWVLLVEVAKFVPTQYVADGEAIIIYSTGVLRSLNQRI